MRGKKTVTILEQNAYDSGCFCFGDRFNSGSLDQVIDSLLGIRALIPDEFRRTGVCEISADGGEAHVYVGYERPETDEEFETRKARNAAYDRLKDERDRIEFERLKAKFGG